MTWLLGEILTYLPGMRQGGAAQVCTRSMILYNFISEIQGYVSDCSSVSPGPCSTPPSAAPSSSITAVPELTSPGMEYVPIWLKHLRLHKYTDFIMGLSYQELMQITEEKLINLNVTKGDRLKILANRPLGI